MEHPAGPLLVFAGPGSGKTRVIAHRIAHLLRNGARAEEILAVTFTRKAAWEMQERVRGLVGDVRGLWIDTFHSICARVLREQSEAFGIGGFAIIDEEAQGQLVHQVIRRLAIQEEKKTSWDLAREYAYAISLTNNLTAPGRPIDWEAIEARCQLGRLQEVYREYRREKRRARPLVLDFDDLLHGAVYQLRRHPQVTAHYRARFRHLLVDEYQDVNEPQYVFLRLLAAEAESLCVVGDDDQCIYAFRGSTHRYLLRFPEDFPDPTPVTLEWNWRCPQSVVEATGWLIANNNPHRAQKRLRTSNGRGTPVRLHRTLDSGEQAQYLTAEITRHLNRGVAPAQIAVLARRHALLEEPRRALVAAGVPGVLDSEAEKQVWQEQRDLRDELRRAAAGRGGRGAGRNGGGTLQEWLQGFLKACPSRPYQGLLVDLLERLLREYEETYADTSVAGLVDFVEAAEVEAGQLGVQLLTLHGAKGLEFDVVYIIGLEDGCLPDRRETEPERIEEERRLLYVGMTRARRELTLCHVHTSDRGYRAKPSRFLEEIPDLEVSGDDPPPPRRRFRRSAEPRRARGRESEEWWE